MQEVPIHRLDQTDPWMKWRRNEIWPWAQAQGISEITENMPHLLMVKILRSKGIRPPPHVTQRSVFDQSAVKLPEPASVQVNAEDLIEAEYRASLKKASIHQMGFNELRAECKRLGMKISRKHRLEDYRAFLSGQNPT